MAEGKKLQVFLPLLIKAYDDLFQEIEIDLNAAIQKADRALEETPLKTRLPFKKAARRRARGDE